MMSVAKAGVAALLVSMLPSFAASMGASHAGERGAEQTKWQLPVTIEALQDVPVRADGGSRQVRGVINAAVSEPFTVKKGQRFQMVAILEEGGCRIEFETRQFDVSSCPWLDGFRDHQADVFAVQRPPELTPQDAAIYQTIVAHTIRPEMEKVSAGSRLPARPPLLIFDHTLATCDSTIAQQREVGCIDDLVFDALEGGPRIRELVFADLLGASARTALVKDLRQRNLQPAWFPPASVFNAITFRAEELSATLARHKGRTIGYAAFSVPAYSGDGQALVYATYFCGSLCGKGWLLLLHQVDGAWTVQSARMLWIS